jgi:hypothetical protein
MGFAESFAKQFLVQYNNHRWPRLGERTYSSGVWTKEMGKILNKTAGKLGLSERRNELKRVDFTWYRARESIPAIVGEHENGWSSIFNEEVPKLLASNASLKVLICYPPPSQHYDIADELIRTLKGSERTRELNEEFLLILGHPNLLINESKYFGVYWCHQDYALDQLNRPWFGEGREVWWDGGDGRQYRARILEIRGNEFKLEIVDKSWDGRGIQISRLSKLEEKT